MAQTYVIQTPNPEFTGYRSGVHFENGKALVADKAKRDHFVNDLHYIDATPEKVEK